MQSRDQDLPVNIRNFFLHAGSPGQYRTDRYVRHSEWCDSCFNPADVSDAKAIIGSVCLEPDNSGSDHFYSEGPITYPISDKCALT